MGSAARRRRSQCGDLARGARQAAGAAQIRARDAPEGAPAVRRLQRRGDGPPAAAVDVAGTDLRTARRGQRFLGRGARALRRGPPRGRCRANSFSYHLTPGGFMMESGAHALGCAVIPAGTGNTEQQVEAIAHLKPSGYLGTPDFLKILLDVAARAGRDASSFKRALVSGAALPASLRQELSARGIEVRQCYATADLGVIAYESEAHEGMIVNETLLIEIVRPGTGDLAAIGEVGEVVVTSFNSDYPMIRLATGDLSAVMAGRSPCGRTNMRLAGWMGRADQTAKIKGMFVHPAQVAQIAKRHPELGRLRLVVARAGEQDVMTLLAECSAPVAQLQEAVVATLRAVTKLGGEVKLVAAGSLPNDGKVIADERLMS